MPTANYDFFSGVLSNHPLMAGVIAWGVAQIYKIIWNSIEEKRLAWEYLLTTGGMPSSHTGAVTALATSLGKLGGWNSPSFAIAAVFGVVVIYDAMGVRRAAGTHAQVLNVLLRSSDPDGETDDLKERLGHTPREVLGGILLGLVVAFWPW